MPAFDLPLFLFGCLGGLLPDVLRIIRNRRKIRLPNYLRKLNFWLGTLLLVGVGGLTAWILSAETAKDALIYGFASPQILSQLAASVQTGRVERGMNEEAGEFSFGLLQWWGS